MPRLRRSHSIAHQRFVHALSQARYHLLACLNRHFSIGSSICVLTTAQRAERSMSLFFQEQAEMANEGTAQIQDKITTDCLGGQLAREQHMARPSLLQILKDLQAGAQLVLLANTLAPASAAL